MILKGIATNSNLGNIADLSSSLAQDPRIRLPPDEKGEIAEACAPMTMQANSIIGEIPVAEATAGTSGNRVGHTTPRVLLKIDMQALMSANVTGTNIVGILELSQSDKRLMVPALMATAISIPTPQIRIRVSHGTLAITCFCGARLSINATADMTMAISPTSTFELIRVINLLSDAMIWAIGGNKTRNIIIHISAIVIFWTGSNWTGFSISIWPSFSPLRRFKSMKSAINNSEKITEAVKIVVE